MEAQILLTPQVRPGVWGDDIDVTDLVTSNITFESKPERNEWSYGVVSSGDVRLRLVDPDGKYGPQSFGNSVFALAGRDNARVRVLMPEARGGAPSVEVWRGLTTDKSSRTDLVAGVTTLRARSVDTVLRDAVVGGGNIITGQTIRQAVEAVFQVRDIATRLPGTLLYDLADDIVPGNITLRDALELIGDDRNALNILEQVLRVTDGLLGYSFGAGRPAVFTRGGLPITAHPSVGLADAISINSIDGGAEQVYNSVIMETGLAGDDETIALSSESSITQFGERSLEVNTKWIKSREISVAIGKRLLSRLHWPRRRVICTLDAWGIAPADTVVGQRVLANIPPVASAPEQVSAGRYARARQPRIQGAFWIERVKRELVSDTMTVHLREAI